MKRAGHPFALPLMLLALVLQLAAGVTAARAQAEALDPFASVPICSPNAKTDPAKPAPAGQHGAQHCAVCLISAVAYPPLLASGAAIAPLDLVAVAAPALSRHRLPQGPPERVPNARGPPATA